MQYSKLKVTELKELLTSKGLTTKGLKADLVARLEDHDASTPQAQTEGEGEGEDVAETSAEQVTAVEASPSADQANTNMQIVDQEEVDLPASNGGEKQLESHLVPTSPLPQLQHEANGRSQVVDAPQDTQVDEKVEAGGEAISGKTSQDVATLSSRLDSQPTEKTEQDDSHSKLPETTATIHSTVIDSIVAEGVTQSNQTEATTRSEPARPKKSKGAMPLSSLPIPHPPTRALRVTGLVRPLMVPSLKETLRDKFGELDVSEDVKGGVWLDGIKSCGWIVFKEIASAQKLVAEFDNKPFPTSDSFRTPVAFFYVPSHVVSDLLQAEEACWEKERGRMEIVATTSEPAEEGGELQYEYFARPLREQKQKKIRDPKPPPPSAAVPRSAGSAKGNGHVLNIRGTEFNQRSGPGDNSNGLPISASDASSLPPVSFPPARTSPNDGRAKGGRKEERYHPYHNQSRDQDRHPNPPGLPPVPPMRDAQTELEISRSRDASALAYGGRGGRPAPPSGPYDSRWDESGWRGYERGGGDGYDWETGYSDRRGYDWYDERNREWGRSRGSDRQDWSHRGYSNGSAGRGGSYRDREAVRGDSPGWMGDRAPLPAARSGEDRHSDRWGDRDWDWESDRYDRRSARENGRSYREREEYGSRRDEKREREWDHRDRSPRIGSRTAEGDEDRYTPRARSERD